MQCLQFIFNETHRVPAAGNDNQSWDRLNFFGQAAASYDVSQRMDNETT